MKKVLTILLIITIIISCTACGRKKEAEEKNIKITFNDLKLEIPKEFKESNSNDAIETFKSYNTTKDKDICNLYLTYHEAYVEEGKEEEKIKEWLDIAKTLDNSNAEIEFNDINNTKWGNIRIEQYSSIEYQYSTIVNKKLYTVQYNYSKDAKDTCDKYVKDIMKTLNFN